MSEAVLLLAHGTPNTLGEMAEYLDKVTGGRVVPQQVVEELQHRYQMIGLRDESSSETSPPLTRWTLEQGRLLERHFVANRLKTKVYVAMRNWHPYIADVIIQMRQDGVKRFRAVCLAPQNSRTSVGLYRKATLAAAEGLEVEFVAGWAEHPVLVEAFAEKLRKMWKPACAEVGQSLPVLFTAHSVPCRTVMGESPDPYPVEAKATARLVAERMAGDGLCKQDCYFAFQSQGVSGGPWIGPTVEETLKALREEGHTGVVIQPVGFLCDHVEILYDIDIAFKEFADRIGLKLWRAESLNDSPLLVKALAEIATGQYRAAVVETVVAAGCRLSAMRRIAIVGGGVAGLAASYELARLSKDKPMQVVLFESSARLGGIIETVREGGFVIECGPDGWVSEKPWARELAEELGLGNEIIPSNDGQRKTYVLTGNRLIAIPDGMRMTVPKNLESIDSSELFSETAKLGFHCELERAEELKTSAPGKDESVADFVRRHFGTEVIEKIGSPLLSGVFGGDAEKLSVRAVMAPFVAMEREHGSLIRGLQCMEKSSQTAIFSSLIDGMGSLVDRIVATIPQEWVRLNDAVRFLSSDEEGWLVGTAHEVERFDAVLMSAPVDVARSLLEPVDGRMSDLMKMDASSAVVVGFGFPEGSKLSVPPGFGFLVPRGSGSLLLACTFVDQKFPHRVPQGGRSLRAFFGGESAERLMKCGNDEIAAIARGELARILGPIPEPQVSAVRRWPRSLPLYAVGHLERMAELDEHTKRLKGLWLLGNGYRGVGVPDLIRDARAAAREAIGAPQTQK